MKYFKKEFMQEFAKHIKPLPKLNINDTKQTKIWVKAAKNTLKRSEKFFDTFCKKHSNDISEGYWDLSYNTRFGEVWAGIQFLYEDGGAEELINDIFKYLHLPFAIVPSFWEGLGFEENEDS